MVRRKSTPAKGDIWHVNGDPASGKEFKGPHYYLVISDQGINQALGVAICLPITSGGGLARSQSVTVSIDGSSTDKGLVTGVVLCYQIRTMDLAARKASYHSKVAPEIMDEVLGIVVDIIDPQP
ncbi:type II toxin-antitoxin system PemK/MazF family toxin [Morganella psychrotolerans]|uniref:Type II toxin-antitoxin system PemK/MazF family toxin n=1 Tax=Morganella psychrotolerans TaxID=368603 RepID=A0A5M9QZN2_9GAMM|nr:type II toxin-antitoxin system PemK/MazF family toxin [Morganella psychrotolerans]KAA8713016.1 type II toxin-antitoxin system PemK/MazF family toxin [Morganella psychrotolerans]OBU01887.1 growth inhibitor PemK [Morganella psychrotolerans]